VSPDQAEHLLLVRRTPPLRGKADLELPQVVEREDDLARRRGPVGGGPDGARNRKERGSEQEKVDEGLA
jgi:hypothetical protein